MDQEMDSTVDSFGFDTAKPYEKFSGLLAVFRITRESFENQKTTK